MLQINNLHVSVEGKSILQGLDLHIQPGEVHAIMGPNGSGKSTLAAVLAGKPGYEITQSTILYQGHDLLSQAPEERAHAGLFLAFQYPVPIPGLNMVTFLQTAYNAIRRARGEKALDALKFLQYLKTKTQMLGIDNDFLKRAVNEGFSGGEKKRHECLQLLVLSPTLAILDETDSGLDIDALRIVAQAVNSFTTPTNALMLITHYQRILEYIVPDKVSILYQGRITQTGDKELARQVEQQGYAPLVNASKAL